MHLFSYIVREDHGFAPNPFGGFCTLATCKPVVRRVASPGDWVIGTGSSRGVGAGKLVYAMKLSEVVSLEDYSVDERYEIKIPYWRGEGWRRAGDNIYRRDEQGRWKQQRSYHKPDRMEHDLSGQNALVGDEFYYFGREAPEIPEELLEVVKRGPGHLRIKDQALIVRFKSWLRRDRKQGILGAPLLMAERLFQGAQAVGDQTATCRKSSGSGSRT